MVDVGAHIGTMTVPLAHAVGSEGRVFAIEAQRVLAALVATNCMVNGISGVQVAPRGCWCSRGQVINAAVGNEVPGTMAFVSARELDYISNMGSTVVSPCREDGPAVCNSRCRAHYCAGLSSRVVDFDSDGIKIATELVPMMRLDDLQLDVVSLIKVRA